jgi:mono/diheme cytochrome c family protein
MGLSSFMPAWQGIFKDKEIEALVAYIRSLAAAK